jgi:riboflavin biosynthesis pyrimidine reductase
LRSLSAIGTPAAYGWQDRHVHSLFPTSPAELSNDDLVELYAYPAEQRWVRANFVASVDGAAQGPDKRSGSLSDRADQRLFALLRSLADVIVVGAGTARAEGYAPVRQDEVDADIRAAQGLAPAPAIAVVSRSLDLDPALVSGGIAPTIIVTTDTAPPDRLDAARELAEGDLLVCGHQQVSFGDVFDALAGMGLHRILCEGGPSTMYELCASDTVDELCLTVSPLITAGDRLRLAHGPALQPPRSLQLRHVLEADGSLFLRYLLSPEHGQSARLE